MDSQERKAPKAEAKASANKPKYEPPKILWEEEWIPVTLALSCARLPGQNARCHAAPGS